MPEEAPKPKAGDVLLLVGTKKGAFFLHSDKDRRKWDLYGPHFGDWGIYHLTLDQREEPTIHAGFVSLVWGSTVHRSKDYGRSWDHRTSGLHFARDSALTLERVWHLKPGLPEEPGVLYAGVEPAALFRSRDGGITWEPLDGLNQHPSRSRWTPGNGGLCLHTILVDPSDPRRLTIAISAAGVFRSDDGGANWHAKNRGLRWRYYPNPAEEFENCVHKMALHPRRPQVIYQQHHSGVYRSDDGGESWTEISEGLPSGFGFPIAVHPHDPETIYVIPESSDQEHWMPNGAMAVYRGRDSGNRWERLTQGLPQRNAYLGVLREGMATDTLDPCGIYVATNTGQIFASRDEGDSWEPVADYLPPIYSITCAVLEG